MSSNGSAGSVAEPRSRFPGLAWASRSLSRSWRCMEARSGSRALSGTGPHFTSPFLLRSRTPHRCSAGMPEAVVPGGSSLFTVLVADDNDVAQRLCKRVLENAGYSVLIAADGLQAGDVAVKQHPLMILLDGAMARRERPEAMG